MTETLLAFQAQLRSGVSKLSTTALAMLLTGTLLMTVVVRVAPDIPASMVWVQWVGWILVGFQTAALAVEGHNCWSCGAACVAITCVGAAAYVFGTQTDAIQINMMLAGMCLVCGCTLSAVEWMVSLLCLPPLQTAKVVDCEDSAPYA